MLWVWSVNNGSKTFRSLDREGEEGGAGVGGGGRTWTGSGPSEEKKKLAKKHTENGAMRAREGSTRLNIPPVDISLIGVPRKKKEAGVNSIDAGTSPSPVDTAAVCFHFWPPMFSITSE